ncbi:uncharacterized protein JCM6883_000963 [Sporobolomyces salmoneus]|uniref:uncharacterized protein n=1 Tax=Sporobolomyces salmoneus TaxID=183962 RepID=UPI0031768133
MEDQADGLSLPSFAGRIQDRWDIHESNLRSWLFIRGIPLHSEEAARALVLSLSDAAAIQFHQHNGPNAPTRTDFDSAVRVCRAVWMNPARQKISTIATANEVTARTFRCRGKRQETVKDLVNDLELLWCRLPRSPPLDKRLRFVSAFVHFPTVYRTLLRSTTYEEAVVQALCWERFMTMSEQQGAIHAAQFATPQAQTRPFEWEAHLSTPTAGPPRANPTSNLDPVSPTSESISTDIDDDESEEDELESDEDKEERNYSIIANESLQPNFPSNPTSLHAIDPSSFSPAQTRPLELSQADRFTPQHSTPPPSSFAAQFPRPPQSRPPLPSFQSPQNSFSRRAQSVELERIPEQFQQTPPLNLTKPLFHPHTHPPLNSIRPLPATTQHQRSTSFHTTTSTEPSRPRSARLRKNPPPPSSSSKHSRSVSQPVTPFLTQIVSNGKGGGGHRKMSSTDSTSTISRSKSLLSSLFSLNRRSPSSTTTPPTTGTSFGAEAGGGGVESSVVIEGETSFGREESVGKAPKQRLNVFSPESIGRGLQQQQHCVDLSVAAPQVGLEKARIGGFAL